MKTTGGSVIWGTLREEDLIPAFMSELEKRDNNAVDVLTATYSFDGWPFDKSGLHFSEVFWGKCKELAPYLLADLFDALNQVAPEGCYFGPSEGDGTDFSFWATKEEA